jgi:hypothetical protein
MEFTVACTATSGVIGILIRASGLFAGEEFTPRLDQSAWPNWGQDVFLTPGSRYYLAGIPAGDHVISLASTFRCSVDTRSQAVHVTAGGPVRDTVEVDFSVTCSRSAITLGTLRISAPTTGPLPPSTRYSVWYSTGLWDDLGAEWTLLDTLAPNGTLVAKVPASGSRVNLLDYVLDLRDLPANCSARGGTPDPQNGFLVAPRDTLDLVFTVTCAP